ncbi:MAG: hypothetical protein QXP01_09250 [Candidatus Hadarchaeum sp.]
MPTIRKLTKLNVQITPHCLEGSLLPRYVDEADYIVMDSPVKQPWPLGVNIDNLVILDFNPDAILASVEILTPRKLWKRRVVSVFPEHEQEGSIRFLATRGLGSYFLLPPQFTVYSSLDERVGVVLFGELDGETVGVRLSAGCLALVCLGNLVGFIFDMPPEARKRRSIESSID